MAQQQKLGWSSLPADFVNCVADCLLATNDLDFYMDLRAVCHNWRAATADPRRSQHDPRFRASQWVMLDERDFSSASDGDRLFVNATTGRFLRKTLPPSLLRDYAFVTATTGGLLVLAARGTPRAVRVLNPFTGSSIRFSATLPNTEPKFTAVVVGSSPTLFLAGLRTNKVYFADPQSDDFSVEKHVNCPASRLPLIAAGKFGAAGSGGGNILDRLASEAERCRCYAVETAGGDMLAVLKRRRGGFQGRLCWERDPAGQEHRHSCYLPRHQVPCRRCGKDSSDRAQLRLCPTR